MKGYLRRGDLSVGSLACGYVQQKNGAKLWREHECYHLYGETDKGEVVRYSTGSLELARKAFSLLAAGKLPQENPNASLLVSTGEFVDVISISALGNSSSWDWNDVHYVGMAPASLTKRSPRRILRWMRENDFLAESSKGKMEVVDDGYNLVIAFRHTREPLLALVYGETK